MFGSLSKNLVMVEGQSNLFVLSAAAVGLVCQQYPPYSRLSVPSADSADRLFFGGGGVLKRSTSLCSILLISSILSTTRPSPSLLIFIDLSANGLIILNPPPPPGWVCLVSLNSLQTREGGANWPPHLFFYLVTLCAATPLPLSHHHHHHPDDQSKRHDCPACCTEAGTVQAATLPAE